LVLKAYLDRAMVNANPGGRILVTFMPLIARKTWRGREGTSLLLEIADSTRGTYRRLGVVNWETPTEDGALFEEDRRPASQRLRPEFPCVKYEDGFHTIVVA
jgi:hypothetical protein